MKTIIVAALVSLTLTAGCSKKSGGSCEDLFDHTVSLLPEGMKDQMAGQKDAAIAKCEKLSPEAKKCAFDATSMDDLMKCPKK